jgi:riboflavin transporter FmnP
VADSRSKPQFIAHTALFLALGILLPFGLHFIPAGGIPLGRALLPMHIPVLLAGFLAGPASGIIVGLLAPGLSHLLTGMPPTYAVAPMTLELAMYGLVAGITYQRLKLNIYLSLIIAMLFGRLLFGLGLFVLGMLMQLPYTATAYFSGGLALVSGLPGIALQLVLIPIIVAAVNRKRGGR